MKNVLIADDHEVTRRGLREILGDSFEDLLFFEAPDAHEAIALIPRHPWALILLDILMPGPRVVQVLEQIRARDAQVPVLILTALRELEYVPETMRAGANGFIHKHRAADELVEAVRRVMAGGTYLHPETAAAIATDLRNQTPPLHDKLSQREREIFLLIARGHSIKQIAGELQLSDKTVATYLGRIREKTGLISLVDIARYALQHHLTE